MVHKILSSLNKLEKESYSKSSVVSVEDMWFNGQDTSLKDVSPYVSVSLHLQRGQDT